MHWVQSDRKISFVSIRLVYCTPTKWLGLLLYRLSFVSFIYAIIYNNNNKTKYCLENVIQPTE